MTDPINVQFFKKEIRDMEEDIYFQKVKWNPDYHVIKARVLKALKGDFDFNTVQKDIELMEDFLNHAYDEDKKND